MKVSEFKKLLDGKSDEEEITIYVEDYEYNEDEPQELGVAVFTGMYGKYLHVGLNK